MSIDTMKMNELRDLAKERGVDIKGLRKKDEIAAAIKAAEQDEMASADEPVVVEAEIIEDGQEPAGELAVSFSPGVLSANFSALDAHIDSILSEYEGWEPSADSEDDVKQCAVHRKYLNGLAKQIDEKRKAYKNDYLRPLNAFEAECNRIRDKVKDVSNRLSDVEKDADEARKYRKKKELEEHYEAYAGLLAEVVPYDRIADPKWLNKQPTLEKARIELEDKVDKVAADWDTLKRLNLEFFEQAELHFFQTLDLGQATAYADKLAEDKRKLDAMKAEMEQYAEPEPVAEPADDAVPLDTYEDVQPTDEYEPFDPMTCEQEHRPVAPMYPEPLQPMPAQPVNAPVGGSGAVSQQIAAILATYPESRQQNILEALRAARQPSSSPMKPYVMILDGATPEQLQVVGKFCGLVGVTGTFKQGGLQEVAQRVARENVGQVFAYGA